MVLLDVRSPGVRAEDIDRAPASSGRAAPLIDPFARAITYLRLSVTDRCDLRCTYCMTERMQFLPKREVLSLEELDRLASAFIAKGVSKLRITGGEPLVRRGVVDLMESLARHLRSCALEELTLTTNATHLAQYAERLARAGVRRVNVSIDSLHRETYARIARRDMLDATLEGIAAAQAAGLSVKANAVALKEDNASELPAMIEWAHARGVDFTIIEAMPMGEIDQDRFDQYIPLSQVRADLEARWTLTPIGYRTGGPSRYVQVEETGGRLGFITPLSHNFCEACNRVRVTCTGRLFMCLGQEDDADLRAVMRAHPDDDAPLHAAIEEAITRKPKGHDFVIDRKGAAPASPRHMSVTGG